MHKPFTRLLLLLLSVTALCACRRPTADSDRPVLTVSIEPLRYVVEAIAGNKYEVHTLMPQGASPETYEPTPRQMMDLNDCQIVFRTGTSGFEQSKLPQIARAVPDLCMVSLAQGITPLRDNTHSHGTEGESIDPHAWLSPQCLLVMAQNAANALCQADSANAPYYQQRLKAFEQQMDKLDAELRRSLMPLQGRTFLIYHPALGYLARQYGLHQLAVEHDGKEPSAAYMQQLANRCRAEGVKVVFVSKEHTGRAARRLAQDIGAKVVEINPLSYDVPEQMKLIAKSLKQ